MTSPASPIWHPFTQHALTPDFPLVTHGEGAWLETKDGKLLDAISSWWVITHGHRHPRIVDAIKKQADALDQVIFANFTHQPAEDLARGLIEIVPPGLAHVFYSDSGSTSVEVALKMALGFWKNTGQARTKILALEHAYHGDTVGTMSAGARGVFNAAYDPLLFDVIRLPFPQGRGCAVLAALEDAAKDAAALIVEPLILGAGGMLTYDAELLRKMHALCKRHGTLFIADEVMTGFGRTGTLFACEQAGITPDILCIAKGLTGGSLPLAATLCTPQIFDAHYSTDRSRTFFHSSSFTANPIACAAACANLEIWRDEPVRERIAALAGAQEDRLAPFRADPRFADVRRLGTIAALDLKVPDPGYLAGLGPQLAAFFLERGVLLRPLGNTIYVMPPYCTTAAELGLVYDGIRAAAEKFA
ncbi:MAG: adenosylmethionine-8-amino-7-oxononanoate aminotransferase [Alphaproteobacteria bacterium]|jgi:adenosylmethionine-8-amino-7-oxononanoate aminotransferase|nr:adenosylmethionine-8-amino-7-oxononanoate aminotransferase [Alphaproteobacteria bacterium]MDB5741077.1 adenosylmethionine-8-amino-7-oxononanoate aminotransferase [Alphaproteobacteria bacterium]